MHNNKITDEFTQKLLDFNQDIQIQIAKFVNTNAPILNIPQYTLYLTFIEQFNGFALNHAYNIVKGTVTETKFIVTALSNIERSFHALKDSLKHDNHCHH